MREFMPLARRNPQKRVKAFEHKLYLKIKHNLRLTKPQSKLKNEEMREVVDFLVLKWHAKDTKSWKQHMYNML